MCYSGVPRSSVNDTHGVWRRKVIADETFGGQVMNASGRSTAYFLPTCAVQLMAPTFQSSAVNCC